MVDAPLRRVIEIPKGSRNTYEYDAELGGIKLDRFISASVVYPTDYGCVPETLVPDGDPLDVLMCVSEPTFPGCAVLANSIELVKMSDERDQTTTSCAFPGDDPGCNEVGDVNELPAQLRAEISHFFSVDKDLDPARHSEVKGWSDRDAAVDAISEARAMQAPRPLTSLPVDAAPRRASTPRQAGTAAQGAPVQNRPTVRPAASMSTPVAPGVLPSPGIWVTSPQSGTSQPAPV